MAIGLSKQEIRFIHKHNNPSKVQGFINSLKYNPTPRLTVPDVLSKLKGDCFEGACTAAIVLLENGYDSFLIDLEAVPNKDEDHVLAVYKKDGLYGAIAQSKFHGLRERMPVYKSIRELVMSYFESYYNFYGEYSLNKYSLPVRLEPFIKKYGVNSEEFMEKVEERLFNVRHFKILSKNVKLERVGYDKFWHGIKTVPSYVKIGKRYQKK